MDSNLAKGRNYALSLTSTEGLGLVFRPFSLSSLIHWFKLHITEKALETQLNNILSRHQYTDTDWPMRADYERCPCKVQAAAASLRFSVLFALRFFSPSQQLHTLKMGKDAKFEPGKPFTLFQEYVLLWRVIVVKRMGANIWVRTCSIGGYPCCLQPTPRFHLDPHIQAFCNLCISHLLAAPYFCVWRRLVSVLYLDLL